MDLLDITKELCKKYGIVPSRTKGQNFLITEKYYEKIIEAADLQSDDNVLEVGPGLGFLTVKLAQKAGKVVAVELDDKLAVFLAERLRNEGIKNVEVVNENILDFSIKYLVCSILNNNKNTTYNIQNTKYKIVANLPYNITSVFLRKFLTAEQKPELMVLMLQKEVAERICAKPGEMSLLSVSVQFYAQPEIVAYVPKDNFWPKPDVDSAIIKLKVISSKSKVEHKENIYMPVDKEKDFFRMVKFGFSSRRKMLKNNLAAGYHVSNEIAENWLKNAGLEPKIRAQELGIAGWLKLFEVIG